MLRSVVVVGASLAGLRACEGLRHAGFDGRITLVGAEPYLPYDRPPLSKEFLAGASDVDRLALTSPAKLAGLDLELVLGERARAVDLATRVVSLESGRAVSFDGLIVATGATPRELRGAPRLDGVLTLRRLGDAFRLRALLGVGGVRLVVIGGGFLGMEVAATAARTGCSGDGRRAPGHTARRVWSDRSSAGRSPRSTPTMASSCVPGIGVEGLVGVGRVEGVRLEGGKIRRGGRRARRDRRRAGDRLGSRFGARAGGRGPVCRDASRGAGRRGRRRHRPLAAPAGRGDGAARAPDERRGTGGARRVEPARRDRGDAVRVGAVLLVRPVRREDPVDRPPGRRATRCTSSPGSIAERRFVACYGRDGQLSAAIGFNSPRQLMGFRALLDRRATLEEALATAMS